MYLRNDFWHYDFVMDGVRHRGSTGFKKNEKTKATNAITKLKVQIRENHSIDMMWEQVKRKKLASCELLLNFEDIWDAYNKKNSRQITVKRTKNKISKIKIFCDWMQTNYPTIKKVSQVTSLHAIEWMNTIFEGDGANDTKNDYLMNLKSVFTALGKDFGIIENPFDEIKKLPKNSSNRNTYMDDELNLICEKAKGWIYSLCITAMSTGLREGDICLLKKASVDLEKRWLSIAQTQKTGVKVDIPIMPKLFNHLKEKLEEDNDSDYIFPSLAEKYLNVPDSIGKEVKLFFEEIGITNTTQKIDGYRRKVSTKDVHSFRHTFVYLAAVHGIPFPIVQGIVGHTNPQMTKHYMDHATRAEKNQYFKQLPNFLTGEKKHAPRKLTKERVIAMIQKLTPENLDRNKARILELLS